jgi:hypothetical protein
MSARGSKPMKAKVDVHRSPDGGGTPARIALTIATYSRISVVGLPIS